MNGDNDDEQQKRVDTADDAFAAAWADGDADKIRAALINLEKELERCVIRRKP